jgi:NADH dehydrogenase FAD-containing subunit
MRIPHLLLVGPGPAHLFVLEALARGRIPAAETTLVVPRARQIHAAMVPGVIEGRYQLAEITLDLSALARQAGATFQLGEVVRVDAAGRVALLQDGMSLPYDVASLAVAGVPHGVKLPGVEAHAAFARSADQVAELVARLDRLAEEARPEPRRVIVAGAGDRGIELALAARARLDRVQTSDVIITMFDGRASLFGGRFPDRADLVQRVLAARDIALRLGTAVSEVGPDFVRLSGGRVQPADLVIWTSGTDAPPLFKASDLAADGRGRLLLEDTLQVPGTPTLFGSGDGVILAGSPGGSLVEEQPGPVLAHNLAACLGPGAPSLRRHRPAAGRLLLLDTGQGRAAVFCGPVALETAWAMRLKARRDRRFVSRFQRIGGGTAGAAGP